MPSNYTTGLIESTIIISIVLFFICIGLVFSFYLH